MNLLLVLGYLGLRLNTCLHKIEKEKRFPKTELPVHISQEKKRVYRAANTIFYIVYCSAT
jgi:hypothetical protein